MNLPCQNKVNIQHAYVAVTPFLLPTQSTESASGRLNDGIISQNRDFCGKRVE